MKKRTREIVALLVFVLLLVCAGAGAYMYFSTGKSWTVAATLVDDSMGQMNGYAALVYPGVKVPAEAADDASSAEPGADQGVLVDIDSEGSAEADAPISDAESASSLAEVDAEEDGSTDQQLELGAKSSDGTQANESDLAAITDSIGLRILSILPDINHSDSQEDVYVSDVNDLYSSKDAYVVSANFSNLDAYSSPVVYNIGQKRMAVFSVDYYATKSVLSKLISQCKEKGADIIVCVAPRQQMLASLDGINVLVATDQDDLSTRGTTVGSTLVTSSPEIGQVGVVLFSNSNVASSREINSL